MLAARSRACVYSVCNCSSHAATSGRKPGVPRQPRIASTRLPSGSRLPGRAAKASSEGMLACSRARARSWTMSSPSGTQEGIRRLRQGLHPRQIVIDDFGPGGQLPLQARSPIRALIARFLPAPGVLKLLRGIVRQPQPADQLMALHLAAQQPPQRLHRHRHRRIAPGFLAQNSRRIGDSAQGGRG